MSEKVKYIKYCVFHPFDGFYEAKNRGRGSLIAATVLLCLYGILQCVKVHYHEFQPYHSYEQRDDFHFLTERNAFVCYQQLDNDNAV